MKITIELLQRLQACREGQEAFEKQKTTEAKAVIRKCIRLGKIDWANWLIVRIMTKNQKIYYACYAAELALGSFERLYPEDNRPRKAIEAARSYADSPTKKK